MNHPDRLKYPMKRVGKRGEGKFERISWDEALDTIGDNLKRILKAYGNEAVHVLYGTGVDGGNITNSNVPYRLMNSCGGYLSRYGSYSTAQISAAMSYMFGSNDGNSPDDIANTKLVVMFGNNPAETRMSGGGVTYYVEQARERSNARMIVPWAMCCAGSMPRDRRTARCCRPSPSCAGTWAPRYPARYATTGWTRWPSWR